MKVTLFCDIKSEGWRSMERYASALAREFKTQDLKPKVEEFGDWQIPEVLFSGRKKFFWRFGVYPFLAQLVQGDVNHIIDHSYAKALRFLDPRKTIITCHDLIPLEYEKDPEALSIFKATISYLPKAAKIISVSEATKKDLVEKLDIAPEKVVVVYEGVGEKFKVQSAPPKADPPLAEKCKVKEFNLPLEKKIVLHVGNSLAYKNIEGLLEAFSLVKEKEKDVVLVKVGHFTQEQMKLTLRLKLKSEVEVFERPGLSEDDLVSMYNLATVTCIPSFKEGFGFPVLESMACGTPVVCSNVSSLPEIGGDAAVYCNPKDPADIAQKLLEVISYSKSIRYTKVEEGLRQAKKFTWQKCAAETLGVYKEVFRS